MKNKKLFQSRRKVATEVALFEETKDHAYGYDESEILLKLMERMGEMMTELRSELKADIEKFVRAEKKRPKKRRRFKN